MVVAAVARSVVVLLNGLLLQSIPFSGELVMAAP